MSVQYYIMCKTIFTNVYNLCIFTIRYADLYNNADQPLATEHRDTVLEILSDARNAAPLLHVGLLHSKVNPRSYMYVFGHNSRAGEYAKASLFLTPLRNKSKQN